jgi:hypothetical protein
VSDREVARSRATLTSHLLEGADLHQGRTLVGAHRVTPFQQQSVPPSVANRRYERPSYPTPYPANANDEPRPPDLPGMAGQPGRNGETAHYCLDGAPNGRPRWGRTSSGNPPAWAMTSRGSLAGATDRQHGPCVSATPTREDRPWRSRPLTAKLTANPHDTRGPQRMRMDAYTRPELRRCDGR